MSHNLKMEIKKMAMRNTSSIICLNLLMNKYTSQSVGLNFHELFVLLHWLTQMHHVIFTVCHEFHKYRISHNILVPTEKQIEM